MNGPTGRERTNEMLPPETLGRFQEMISLAVESIRLSWVIGCAGLLQHPRHWLARKIVFGAPRYFRVRNAPSGLGALIKVSSLIGFCLLKQIRVYYRISTINLSKR